MKRLAGLAVLVSVLYMNVPAYGEENDYYLIYNVSCAVKGANGFAAATVPWKAYLVLDVNSKVNDYVDANLIIYGKNSLGYKVYLLLNKTDPNSYLGVDIWLQGNMLIVDTYNNDLFSFAMLLVGKVVEKDIGFSTNVGVPASLRGDTMFFSGELFNSEDRLTGTGNASASLWLSKTQFVNENGWTRDQIIITGKNGNKSLTQILQANGYTNITPVR